VKQRAPVALAFYAACVLAFGGLAVFLGADASWDTRNYHVYNPYSLLTGRLHVDLAPAQMQTYFNPLIDLPVHWLHAHLPPRGVAWMVGAFQALCVVLVFLIARTMLVRTDGVHGWVAPASLALLGALSAPFVAQLGTSYGDSSSAVFVLVAVYLLCRSFDDPGSPRASFFVSCGWIGLCMGVATGLKLTNAPFAVAMGVVLVVVADSWRHRLLCAAGYALGAAVSFALATGWWFWRLWQSFGNPLFPQFNSVFGSDLATATSVIDTRWGPVTLVERIGWPWWMSFRPERLHDSPMYNYLWVAVYGVLIVWALSHVWHRIRRPSTAGAKPSAGAPDMLADLSHLNRSRAFAAVVLFSGISYLIWLKVFSIGRYMIPVEILLPVLMYGCLCRWLSAWKALAVSVVVSVASLGFAVMNSNFGLRAAWGERAYTVEVPEIDTPATATLVVAVAGEPISWIFPAFPADMAILRVSGNFPNSVRYDRRVAQTIAGRKGRVYVVAQAPTPWNAIQLEQVNFKLSGLSASACRWAARVMGQMRHYRHFAIETDARGACVARSLLDVTAVEATSTVLRQRADAQLKPVGLKLVPGSCRVHAAFVGRMALPYEFCETAPSASRPAD
jgi:hypothetical protein